MKKRAKRRNIPVPSKKELEELLRKHTQEEVAEMCGASQSTVGLWKKELGITTKRGPKPVPEGFVEYAKNHTRAEAAKHFEVSYEMIRSMEKKAGVRCSGKSYGELESIEDLKVLLKYFSKKEIAERFSVTEVTIYNWLRNENLNQE